MSSSSESLSGSSRDSGIEVLPATQDRVTKGDGSPVHWQIRTQFANSAGTHCFHVFRTLLLCSPQSMRCIDEFDSLTQKARTSESPQ